MKLTFLGMLAITTVVVLILVVYKTGPVEERR